jgi:hypothetical protein
MYFLFFFVPIFILYMCLCSFSYDVLSF